MANREFYIQDWKTYAKCWCCWQYKEATTEYFSKDKTWLRWLRSWCKCCDREYHKIYIKNNKGNIQEYNRKYEKTEKRKAQKRLWAETHKDSIRYAWKKYREINKDKIEKRLKEKEYWERMYSHKKTRYWINKLWIRPSSCTICWKETTIIAHHPDYNKRNKVVFCCHSCHNYIHNGTIQCPEPIDLINIPPPRQEDINC